MPERQIKVVCGLNNETNILLKERLQEAAERKGAKLRIVSRYRKEGVYQYVVEHPDYQHVILQEIMQSSSPYTAEDAALLTDERNVRVIIVLNKSHAGKRYMRVLYAAGILDALYEDEAYAEKIVDLLFRGRTRKEARKYYGIETVADVEKSMQIIDEERLKNFLSYMEGGGPFSETVSRYEFIAARMTAAENLHLIKNMGSRLAGVLSESELFQYYNGYLNGKSKKRFSFWKRKGKDPLEPEAVLLSKKDEAVMEYHFIEKETNSHMEALSVDESIADSSITPEMKGPEPAASMKEDDFDTPLKDYEEESLFDLFGDEVHTSILDFLEEERGMPEREEQKISALPLREDLQKAEEKQEGEARGILQPPLSRTCSSSKLSEKVKGSEKIRRNKEEAVPLEKGRAENKGYMPKINKKLALAVGVAFIGIVLLLLGFIDIYTEKEIPMIEEIPVSAKTEEEELSVAKALQEEAAAEDIIMPEEEEGLDEGTEEQQGDEGEDQNVQEETKENEPQGTVGVAEKSDTTKESVSSGKPDRWQKAASSKRTEANAAGEASDAVTDVQEPFVDISREAIAGETQELEGLETSQEQNLQDCNGKIFSGDELAGLAASLQQNGFQVYIITRENGEGYFSADEIREKCGAACSFLSSADAEEVKLVEQ